VTAANYLAPVNCYMKLQPKRKRLGCAGHAHGDGNLPNSSANTGIWLTFNAQELKQLAGGFVGRFFQAL